MLLTSGMPDDLAISRSTSGTAGLTHNASGTGVDVAVGVDVGSGVGGEVGVTGISVAGTHAARMAIQTSIAKSFFIYGPACWKFQPLREKYSLKKFSRSSSVINHGRA